MTEDHFQVEDSGTVRVITRDGAWESLSPAASRAVMALLAERGHTRRRADAAEVRAKECDRRLLQAHETLTNLGAHTCDAECPCPFVVKTALSAAAALTKRLYAEEP